MKKQGKVWGVTSPLFNKNNVEVHFCEISIGGYCSKHFHRTKYNRFVILEGRLKVTIWKDYAGGQLEDVSYLNAGDECTVPPGDYHKFEAITDTKLLEIYWVELNENDIVRFDHGGILNETAADNKSTDSGSGNNGSTIYADFAKSIHDKQRKFTDKPGEFTPQY